MTLVSRVITRLEDLGPIARISAAYLRLFLTRPEVEDGIAEYLSDPDRNVSPVTEAWLYACMVEHPGSIPKTWVLRARHVTQNRNGLTFHRSVAASLLALGRRHEDLSWLKRELRREYDPELVRAYLVALTRIGALDKATAHATKARMPSLEPTLNYLLNRVSLPSMVWRGQTVKVKPV
jgi:hypothetical protein